MTNLIQACSNFHWTRVFCQNTRRDKIPEREAVRSWMISSDAIFHASEVLLGTNINLFYMICLKVTKDNFKRNISHLRSDAWYTHWSWQHDLFGGHEWWLQTQHFTPQTCWLKQALIITTRCFWTAQQQLQFPTIWKCCPRENQLYTCCSGETQLYA